MRIAVTGATGNVGVRVVERLLRDPAVTEVVGISRRPPATGSESEPRLRYVACDIGAVDAPAQLATAFAGMDAVIHLAWLIQPSHQPGLMAATNVDGTAAVLRAVGTARVAALIHASSVGAYSPGPDKVTRVDESWPCDGIPGSLYSQHKAQAERMLDAFQTDHPEVRIVRVRPAVVLQREASAEQARYFLGRLIPTRAIRRSLIPVAPLPDGLVLQVVHAIDIAELFVLAALSGTATGAFNGADEPLLTPEVIAEVLGARRLRVPESVVRFLVDATWRLRLQPTDRGWVELGLRSPLMDTSRARSELGWSPRHDAAGTLGEALDGFADKAAGETPVLARSA